VPPGKLAIVAWVRHAGSDGRSWREAVQVLLPKLGSSAPSSHLSQHPPSWRILPQLTAAVVLRELGELLREELQPVGYLENLLVERVIAAYWRLRRLGRVEAGIFAWGLYAERADRARKEADTYTSDLMDVVRTADITVTDERKHREALSRAKEMEAMQDAETATLGRTFIRDADKGNAFSNLSRYETTLERSLYKALHELQRLQAARRTEGNVPPPVAVDLDVSGVLTDDL
jgi:hypothetical protein